MREREQGKGDKETEKERVRQELDRKWKESFNLELASSGASRDRGLIKAGGKVWPNLLISAGLMELGCRGI